VRAWAAAAGSRSCSCSPSSGEDQEGSGEIDAVCAVDGSAFDGGAAMYSPRAGSRPAESVRFQNHEQMCPMKAGTPSRRGPVLLLFCVAGLIVLWAAGLASARQWRWGRPIALTQPTIKGAAAVGHVLHASSGRWTGAATFHYKWQRCNSTGGACKPIGIRRRHEGNLYVPTRLDVGRRLRVTVIAGTARGSASSTSRPTPVITFARAPVTRPAPPPGSPVSPVSPPDAPAAPSGSPAQYLTAYVTGYDIYDNTPPGSPVISNPVLHQVAGGTGTYQDPITVAVGHSIINGQDILDWPQATRFYIPNLRRYFLVEDTCGDGPTPQNGPCHNLNTADPGAQTWLDVWVDGSHMGGSAARSCESGITHNQLVIENPAPGYAVVPAAIAGSSCTHQYGNTIVRAQR
jgi:hypothetical protein